MLGRSGKGAYAALTAAFRVGVPCQAVLRPLSSSSSSSSSLDVVYEDGDYFFINKPYGVAVSPAPMAEVGSKLSYMQQVARDAEERYGHTPTPVIGLPEQCTGLVPLAKNYAAEQHLKKLWASSTGAEVHHGYVALCTPMDEKAKLLKYKKSKLVRKGLMRHPKSGRYVLVDKGGDLARVKVHCAWTDSLPASLLKGEDSSLLASMSKDAEEDEEQLQVAVVHMRPLTRRKQQLRAAACWLNAPIVGDTRYRGIAHPEVLLHSGFISFVSRMGHKAYEVRLPPVWDARLAKGHAGEALDQLRAPLHSSNTLLPSFASRTVL